MAQDIGIAMGENRIAMLRPCHRVMKSTGELGHYHWGGEAKTSDDSQGSEFVEARKLAYLIIAGFCNLQVTLGAEHKLRRLLAAAQVTGRGYRISQS
ncbi:MGMT family protein [Dyadobacter sp. 676]|uniref:MGMT family protein n=1 Tax=Dyadobacter sp. 676 TaxID=3088362 RepID=A0AAU8FHL4_9BACT